LRDDAKLQVSDMSQESNQSILVIEDDILMRQAIESLFEDHDYKVFIANDGVEALAILADKTVDLIITDILMPNMDGIEFLQQLKKLRLSVKIISITGVVNPLEDPNVEHPYLKMTKKLGAHIILEKPFELKKLLEYTKELLD